MFKKMQEFEDLGCTIYSVSTDCIAFSSPKTLDISSLSGSSLGQFKPEVENIESFFTLAPRNYNLTFFQNGMRRSIYKICGLMINSSAQKILTSGVYIEMVKKFLDNDPQELRLEQERTIKNPNLTEKEQVIRKRTSFIIRNMMYKSRAIFLNQEDPRGFTRPFGFMCKKFTVPMKRSYKFSIE